MENVNGFLVRDTVYLSDDTVSLDFVGNENAIWIKLLDMDEKADIKITFPWGTKVSDLADYEDANRIRCKAGYGWDVTEKKCSYDDRTRYWILKRTTHEESTAIRNVSQFHYIMFDNIEPFVTGITHVEISYLIEGVEGEIRKLPVFKKEPLLEVDMFEPVEGTVYIGNKDRKDMAGIRLTWRVKGCEKCLIEPGNVRVGSEGSKIFYIDKTTKFTLRAFAKDQVIVKETMGYLYQDSMMEYFYSQPDSYFLDCRIKVFWKVMSIPNTQLVISSDKVQAGTLTPNPDYCWIMKNTNSDPEFGFEGSVQDITGDRRYTFHFTRLDYTEAKVILDMEPDHDKAILKFDVRPIDYADDDSKGQAFAYGMEWEVVHSAKQVEVLVRYKNLYHESLIDSFDQYVIATNNYQDRTTWGIDSFPGLQAIFIIRVINHDGQVREAVRRYENKELLGTHVNWES